MSKEAKTYARVSDAEKLISQLCEKHPDLFWAIRPNQIAVMGIDNQQRSEKSVAKNPANAKLRLVKGAEKAIFETNSIPTRYIIELYWSDWNIWSQSYRQWVLTNAILEITPEEEKRNKKDCVGFKVLIDVSGVNWDREPNSLPNLLSDDVKFNLDLRPGLNEDGEEPEPEE